MTQMVFINLPVKDLNAAKAFYEAIGFTNNPQFTDETAAAMVLSDEIYVMLLTHEKFSMFATRPIADSLVTTGSLVAISRDGREAVDALTEQAIAAGGREYRERQDLGFMYGRAFEDLDGHVWEPFFMDMAAAQATFEEAEPA